jgi:acyl-CoA synthetase (AMP-forming)/AMP-acid ligase II
VGIAVPKSADVVATVVATLKLGAAYLPLDLSHPADRVAYMIQDSAATLVVTTHDAPVPDVTAILVLDSDAVYKELSAVRDDQATVYSGPSYSGPSALDSAMYVIYTSGSTGRPKGVVVPHEGISSLAATAIDRMGLTSESRVLQFASVGFDVAVFELTMALCVGGRLVFAPDEVRVAGPELTDFLRDRRITHMILPPSLVSALPADCELPRGLHHPGRHRDRATGRDRALGGTAQPARRVRPHRGHRQLHAVRLVGKIRSVFGVDIALRDVFDSPTVAGPAGRLIGTTSARPRLCRFDRPVDLPLAPVQRGRVSTSWDHALALRARTPFDVPALVAAYADVVGRHEPLRTVLEGDVQRAVPVPPLEVVPVVALDEALSAFAASSVEPGHPATRPSWPAWTRTRPVRRRCC